MIVADEIEKVWVTAPSHDPGAAHKAAISSHLIRGCDTHVRTDQKHFFSWYDF